ncbi:hypothetical protein GRI69_01165 [Erythrobacter vulgaris]|uniref:DNA-binding protein n=1 Tax=Qipengyuania vulgaris TaxID=291985 RepID=A0A844XMN9_9SPHN|nr:hypothetical protein [Qipengyuania vulgaris]MXO46870.1 hypothetical protein [Qipengyuania vulgaris]
MPRRLDLPETVYLRTSPTLPVGEAYAALNITRGRAYQLREHNAFPRAPGRMIDTQKLACWLTHPARGARIVWV